MTIDLVKTQREVSSLRTHLQKQNRIAIDLEFDRNRYRYGFNLCLVQLYDGESCYLIDPLSDHLQIDELFPVLEDPEIEKVAFAFQEDHRLLHYVGCRPKNIFDLRIASQLLNYPPASLTNIVKETLDVDMGKSSQDSNWFKRPLSDHQIKYAAKDVLYLLELKDQFITEAEDKNVLNWIREENRNWDYEKYDDSDINNFIKEKDKRDLNEVEWNIFVSLMEYREEIAKQSNKPSYQIINKNLLYEIAKDPKRLNNWTSEKGIFRRLKTDATRKKLEGLVHQAIQQAKELNLSVSRPARKSPDPEEMKKINRQKRQIQQAKAEFFSPIKKRITEEYGDEVSTFLFSNRTVAKIVTGTNGSLEQYKKSLLRRYADELNLDAGKFVD